MLLFSLVVVKISLDERRQTLAARVLEFGCAGLYQKDEDSGCVTTGDVAVVQSLKRMPMSFRATGAPLIAARSKSPLGALD